MNDKKKTGFDVDGVLLNFWEKVCEKYTKEVYSNSWNTPWVYDKWKEIQSDNSFWESLPSMCNPVNITNLTLVELAVYITSLPSEHVGRRIFNLQRLNFPEVPVVETYGVSKYDKIKEYELDYFVDDKPSQCRELKDKGINIIQFVPWYANFKEYRKGNEDIPYITHIGELDLLIEKLEL